MRHRPGHEPFLDLRCAPRARLLVFSTNCEVHSTRHDRPCPAIPNRAPQDPVADAQSLLNRIHRPRLRSRQNLHFLRQFLTYAESALHRPQLQFLYARLKLFLVIVKNTVGDTAHG